MTELAQQQESDGLNESVRSRISGVLAQFPHVTRAVLYGSRALGRYRMGSDIDLVLMGEIDTTQLNRIATALDDLLLPWEIDLSYHAAIENTDLLDHIDRAGVEFYSR